MEIKEKRYMLNDDVDTYYYDELLVAIKDGEVTESDVIWELTVTDKKQIVKSLSLKEIKWIEYYETLYITPFIPFIRNCNCNDWIYHSW